MTSSPCVTHASYKLFLDFLEKELVRKWCSSWVISIYILLRGLTNDTRMKKGNQSHCPNFWPGSSGLVNEACAGSTGVNLRFCSCWYGSSHLEMEISQKHGHWRALSAVNLLVLVHQLWSLAFFHSHISTLQHPNDCYFGPFLQLRNSFSLKCLLTVRREYITQELSLVS